jgi:hypothetical protein
MNSKFLKHIGKAFLGLVILCIVVMSVASPNLFLPLYEAFGLIGVSGGASYAMAGVIVKGADTREAAKTNRPDTASKPGHLQNDISKLVTMIQPDKAVIDTLLRKVKSEEKAKDIQVNFEEVEIRGRELTLDGAISATANGNDTDKYRDIVFDNTDNIVAGETLTSNTTVVAGKPLRLRVEAVVDATTLTVLALNTTDNILPNIADNAVFYRGAPAAGELEAQAPSVTQYPDMKFNYCQRYTAQVEESYIRAKVASNSGFDFKDQNYMRLYDMRMDLEESSVFGQMAKVYSKEKKENIYYANGIYHQLDQELAYDSSGIDNDLWIDWTKELFSGNAGSQDRFVFAGNGLMADILKIASVQKQQDSKRVEIVPGVKVRQVETSFGMLYIMHHKLFDIMGLNNEGMAVDMNNIKRRTFTAMNSSELDLKKSGQRNVKARFIEEQSCLEVRYLDTHRRIVKS